MSVRPNSRDTRFSRAGGVTAPAFVFLLLLLAMPGYALSRLTTWIDWRLLVAAPLVFSVIAFFAYRSDKRRAEAGEWRIPEFTLHLAGLIGGWPGAFLAQRQFRHKTSKTSFQVVFWVIVLVHQFVAVDSLVGWRFTKDALRFINPKPPNHARAFGERRRRDSIITQGTVSLRTMPWVHVPKKSPPR
jgi:uncharacterized membrane protein YsdA (DUF1294 family)